MTWTDERVETAEEALAGRPVRQPDRRRARRRHPQRRDRQGAPARPVRPRQDAVLGRAAAAQAAHAPHMLRVVARRRCAATPRSRTPIDYEVGAGAGADRQRHPDRAARARCCELTEETCHWPIGDPGSRGFLLLRRPVDRRACPIATITRASPTSRPTRRDRRAVVRS